jgi:hypothetical protein
VSVSARARGLIAVGRPLPAASFDQASAPGRVAWNQGTTASVIFAPHQGDCPHCAGYLGQLAEAVAGLRQWATRAMVVAPVAPGGELGAGLAAAAGSGVLVLADGDGNGRGLLGLADDQAVVVQADRYGAVYEVEAVGPSESDHFQLPRAEALVALAQFIDIQCPECGVPSREWMNATPFPLG